MITPSANKSLEVPQSAQMVNYQANPLPPYNGTQGDDAMLGAEYQAALFARCARGDHQSERKYGLCGIICAAIMFPVGFICLFLDSHKRCSRCGVLLPRRS